MFFSLFYTASYAPAFLGECPTSKGPGGEKQKPVQPDYPEHAPFAGYYRGLSDGAIDKADALLGRKPGQGGGNYFDFKVTDKISSLMHDCYDDYYVDDINSRLRRTEANREAIKARLAEVDAEVERNKKANVLVRLFGIKAIGEANEEQHYLNTYSSNLASADQVRPLEDKIREQHGDSLRKQAIAMARAEGVDIVE